MENKYTFRKITKAEIPVMLHLILQRMKWMDEKGLKQWNVTKYDEVYPQSYFEERRQEGQVFVLEDKGTNEVVCAAVLKEHDARWETDEPSLYLRNFASKIGAKGVGLVFMKYAEEHAKKIGKQYFRLDSPEGNETLAKYYEKQGYSTVGECEDGLYKGILRQKLLV